MLGWHFTVARQVDDRTEPAGRDAPLGPVLARWDAGLSGYGWRDPLKASGDVIDHGGNGYPDRLTGRAGPLLDALGVEPGGDRSSPSTDDDEPVDPAEWLIVEVWDNS